ncbi:hypothetical protein HYU82_02070 [Candidatus Saccharibacteria bacterium]|nr:hypothetical protein [Candidatus Saccharibacteria bacterium]
MKRYILGLLLIPLLLTSPAVAQTQQDSGAVGVEGTIPSAAPTQAPTITTPVNGQVFTTLPITVAGLCQNGLLVEVFKNDVFSGSVQCVGGSYSIQIDLFSGRNDLVARQFDALNQASPDSNTVTVTFNDSLPGGGPRISLTTAYSKRGAAPGDTLTWPITISGGTPPFAISVDWGDKSTPDLLSRDSAGDILLQHIYNQSGIYNITIKASDSKGQAAFLQVVGVGNGPIQQTAATPRPAATVTSSTRILIISLIVAIPLLLSSFWLGKKHQLQVIRARIRRGERPF